jgi:hypothetical protein
MEGFAFHFSIKHRYAHWRSIFAIGVGYLAPSAMLRQRFFFCCA